MEGTDEGQGNEAEIQFSDEQQKFIDKLVGNARVKAREKAKVESKAAKDKATEEADRESLAAAAEWEKLSKHHEGRVTELEPYEAEAKAYRELIAGMLKDRIKALGEVAKKAVAALPEGLSELDKLNWLNANEALFGETEGVTRKVGTPARRKKVQQPDDTGRTEHRRLRL